MKKIKIITTRGTKMEITAKFHCWALGHVEMPDGSIQIGTVAIVELEDGKIETAYPHSITFLKSDNAYHYE